MKIIKQILKVTQDLPEKDIISFVNRHLNKRVKGIYKGNYYTGILSGYMLKHKSNELINTLAIMDIMENGVPKMGWRPACEENLCILNNAERIYLITDVELI